MFVDFVCEWLIILYLNCGVSGVSRCWHPLRVPQKALPEICRYIVLFALYTADCRSTDKSCPLVKFADDTELVEIFCNYEYAIYHKQIENVVNWCDKNYLYLNVSRTKEICIDFRKNQRFPKPVYTKGEAVETVDTYKYLGVVFDSKLNWKENINSVLKRK